MKKSLKFFALLLLILGIIQGCERKEGKEARDAFNMKIDEELDAISPLLSLLKIDIDRQKQTNCVLGNALSKSSREQDESSDELAELWKSKWMRKCDFYSEVERITNKTFDAVKNNRSLVANTYYFEVFETSAKEDDLYRKIDLGLFKSLEDCEHFESRARDIRLPTRACQLWSANDID